jgi:hypothetical protein
MQRNRAQCISFGSKQDTEFSLAQTGRILQHRVEHRRQVAGRAADDLQHFRGRRLLLQRLG